MGNNYNSCNSKLTLSVLQDKGAVPKLGSS